MTTAHLFGIIPLVHANKYGRLAQLVEHSLDVRRVSGSSPLTSTNKKVSFVYQTKETFLSDAFLAERGAHYVRDADYVCDARLRRVSRTHRITYHSVAASLIT